MRLFPFHSESERDWHAWCGLFVCCWAGLEMALDTFVGLANSHFGQQFARSGPPLALDAKISFLRKFAATRDNLGDEKEQILRMMTEIDIEKDLRHTIIHGRDRNFLKIEPHVKVLDRSKDKKSPGAEVIKRVVSVDALKIGYENAGNLSICLLGCQSRLIDIKFGK